MLSELTSTAIQCSFVTWLNRDNKVWNKKEIPSANIPKKAPRKHIPLRSKVSDKSNAKGS